MDDREIIALSVGRRAEAKILPAVEPRVGQVRVVVERRVFCQALLAGDGGEHDHANDVEAGGDEQPSSSGIRREPGVRLLRGALFAALRLVFGLAVRGHGRDATSSGP